MQFRYADAIPELEAFAGDLRAFVDPTTIWLLPQLYHSLHGPQNAAAPGDRFPWRFGAPVRNEYLKSRATTDEIEDNGLAVSFAFWFECRQGPMVKRRIETFEVIAGSVAFVFSSTDGTNLHKFSIDIQKSNGPGAQFHAQTKGNFENISRFIEIPRLPLVTCFPTETISLILHEVFPESWPRALAGSARAARHGRQQQSRIRQLLSGWDQVVSNSFDPVGSIRKFRAT